MSLARYKGQIQKLRALAAEKLGAEKVAVMDDDDVTRLIDKEYIIFWGDKADGFAGHDPDVEVIVLIRNDLFHDLCMSGVVAFAER